MLKKSLSIVTFLSVAMFSSTAYAAPIPKLPSGSFLDGNNARLDWTDFTLSDIPPMPDGSSFNSIATLGSFPGASKLTFGQILPPDATLGGIEGLKGVSVGNLFRSVPEIAGGKVGDSPALLKIAENFIQKTGASITYSLADHLVSDLFKDLPGLDKLPFGTVSDILGGDPIDAIPGLANIALSKIPGLDQVTLDKIPGLDKIPINSILDVASYSPVAILDGVFGAEEEKSLFKPISGSEDDGWAVPCNQPKCVYIELSDFRGTLNALPYHGARWIKGGDPSEGGMLVHGGNGALGTMFGGLEPTGRPLGRDLKIVLTDTNQSTGTATFSLFTRACGWHAGCTPIAIGPIPFIEVKENSLVFLGTPNFGNGKSKLPQWAQDKVNTIEDAFKPPEPGQNSPPEDCAKKVLGLIDPSKTDAATGMVPTLIKDALGAGYSASQAAWLVAVAGDKYNFNASSNALISQYGPVAKQFITDKIVDYTGASTVSGLSSSTANHASLYQGALKPCQTTSCSSTGRMIRPSSGVVTSEMGMRFHPIYHVWKLHAGIDVAGGTGTPIRAVDCGKVEYAGWEDGYGNVVVINHGTVTTRSAHLSGINVQTGQTVKQGDVVGLEGMTGGVTGPHLHFSTRIQGRWGPPQNPRNYISFN